MLLTQSLYKHIKSFLFDTGVSLQEDETAKEWPLSYDLPYIQSHKLESVLWHTIKKSPSDFDPELVTALRIFKTTHNERKQRHILEIWRIQNYFHQKGVKLIPYKGLVLAAQVYKHPYQRDSNDIDFAIAEENLQQSAILLRELGYEEHKENSDFQNLKKSRSYYIDYSWVLRDQDEQIICNVELHWKPAHAALYVPLKFSDIMNQTESLEIFGKKLEVFNLVYHALTVIIHHGVVDTWSQLRHMVDLALINNKLSEADKQQLEMLCRENKVLNIYLFGVYFLNTQMGLTGQGNSTPMDNQKKFKMTCKALLRSRLIGTWSARPSKLLHYLHLRDNLQDRIASIILFIKFVSVEIRLGFLRLFKFLITKSKD